LPRSSIVPTTIAFGSATPAVSASANHFRRSATQPSASQSASRSPLPSFSTDPYSTRILARCSSSRCVIPRSSPYPSGGRCPHRSATAMPRDNATLRVFADLLPTGRQSRQPGCENRPMTAVPEDFVEGLEGVVAFTTQIAEPDKDGGALRYRGVDIEDLVNRQV